MKVIKDFGIYLPIIQLNISNWSDKKRKILNLYDETKLIDEDGILHNYNSNSCGTPECKNLTDGYYNILKDDLDLVFKELKFKETSIYMAWFECAYQNMYHGVHNHGSTGFSSCLYLNYDENVHEPLTLVAPYNEPNLGDMIQYQPKEVTEGTFIIFPACLPHFTEPNKSTKPRVVMSANYAGLID